MDIFKKKHKGYFNIEMYNNYKIAVCVNLDAKEINTYLTKINFTDFDITQEYIDSVSGVLFRNLNKAVLILPKDIQTYNFNEALAILTHECYHATTRVLQYIGATHDNSSEECYAHLHEYIVLKVLNIINKE